MQLHNRKSRGTFIRAEPIHSRPSTNLTFPLNTFVCICTVCPAPPLYASTCKYKLNLNEPDLLPLPPLGVSCHFTAGDKDRYSNITSCTFLRCFLCVLSAFCATANLFALMFFLSIFKLELVKMHGYD